MTPELARLLSRNRVNRVSLGAQSFNTALLAVLERRAQPEDVRRSVHVLRDAGFDNISLDLVYGIPGQTPADLDRDLAEALALEPEHVSCYELEAKPGTRFTHAHGAELERQAESMETYFEQVVGDAPGRRLPLVRDGELLPPPREAGRDLRAQHNLAYWLGRDYLGLGIGAVSTIEGLRRRTRRGWPRTSRRSRRGEAPPRELEPLDDGTRRRERVLLGLRLDEPLALAGLEDALDARRSRGSNSSAWPSRAGANGHETLALTERGRYLGGGVTAELLA